MRETGYALIGLTALVAGLVGVLVFALLRFAVAARDAQRHLRDRNSEPAFFASALEEALARLRAQERAQAERADASERLNSEIVESLRAGLLVVDATGDVRTLNPAGRHILDLPAADSGSSGHFRSLLTEAAPLAALIDECLTDGQPILRRVVSVIHATERSHLGVTVSPLFDGQGRPHGAVCLFTDLSAIVDLEEQLRLRDGLARLGELTAGIAHEFRNGLSTIHGYGQLLDLEALPVAYRPYVEGIRQEASALGQVVTNFLNFARPAQLALTPVSLGVLAERAAEEIRQDARSAGGEVVVSGNFGTVEGDEVLLRQAFSNLTRNALEACEGTGRFPRIGIEGRVDPSQGIVRVAVVDNGSGIAEPLRARIFQPFFTTKSHGIGLGLALVQKIVVTHNGRIHVGSVPDGGTRFTVTLPLSAPGQ